MDIDPLWALGGCCRFLSSPYYCMAKPSSSPSLPIKVSQLHTSSKSQSLLLFLCLLFLFLLVSRPPDHVQTKSLPSDPPSSAFMSGFRPGRPKTTDPAGKQFAAEAHEVPSGPNPISN